MRRRLGVLVLVMALLLMHAPSVAHADQAPASGSTNPAAVASGKPESKKPKPKRKKCNVKNAVGDTLFGGLVTSNDCNILKKGVDKAQSAVGDLPGKAVGAVAGSVFDKLTEWATDAATAVTKKVTEFIEKSTTPEIGSDWYQKQFSSMAALGLGLSVLVAMLALGSAAIRRDPEALGGTFIGMWRAGIGTALVLGLTVLALTVADSITSYVAGSGVGHDAHDFWGHAATAWGKDGGKAFGSTMLTFVFALVQIVAAVTVWIELLVRSAAVYVAVLFMPVVLAAGIWPAMRQWQFRLTKLLFVFIAMKPIIVVVLSLAGTAAAAGLGGAKGSVGVLLGSIVILALAAFAPWALMHLVGPDGEGGHVGGMVRGGLGGAVQSGRSHANTAKQGASKLTGRSGGGQVGRGAAGARSAARVGGGGDSGGSGSSPGGGDSPGPSGGGDGGGDGGGGGALGGGMPRAGSGVGAVAAAAGMTQQTGKSAGARVSGPAPGAASSPQASGGGAASGGSASTPGQGGRTVQPTREQRPGGARSAQEGPSGGRAVSPSSGSGQRPGGSNNGRGV